MLLGEGGAVAWGVQVERRRRSWSWSCIASRSASRNLRDIDACHVGLGGAGGGGGGGGGALTRDTCHVAEEEEWREEEWREEEWREEEWRHATSQQRRQAAAGCQVEAYSHCMHTEYAFRGVRVIIDIKYKYVHCIRLKPH